MADGETPAEIRIASVTDRTGLAASGKPQFRRVELAGEQINDEPYLGDARIVRDSVLDSRGSEPICRTPTGRPKRWHRTVP